MSPRVVAVICASTVLLALVSTTSASSTCGMSGVSTHGTAVLVPPAAPSVRDDTASVESDAVPIERPGPVRLDADGDGEPDRIGSFVKVAGRVGAEFGLVDDNVLVIQSDGHGIAVVTGAPSDVARGDSLVATGVVEQVNGRTQVRASSYDVLPVPPRIPEPLALDVSQALGERYESMIVELSGRVDVNDRNRGGHYLTLEAPGGDDVLTVFVPNAHQADISLDRFEPGDRVRVTGVLQQHDFTRPYTSYYEVIPRSAGELVRAEVPGRFYRNALILGGLLILLAAGAVVLLRVQVRRQTKQLADSRARLRRLAEATFEGVVIHADGKIVDVNQAITEMMGYDRDDLIGRNALEFVTESTRPIAIAQIDRDGEDPYECVLVRRDGSTFPADLQAKVVEEEDQKLRVVAIRDATDRKRDEAELLLAKQEAEQVARLKSSLLNNMSHELRTPITSIIGYAELIIEEPPDTHDLFAKRIRESGRRLSETLRSVLDMAQIEAGTMDLHVADVDTGAIACEVVAAHEPMSDETGVPLRLETSDAPVIPTDRVLCYRIMTNLVHNALKFTDVGHVQVTVEESDPGVRFVVEDTGIGIDSDFLPHLFEPFKQESDGRTRTHEGTGLGLAITKRMVDLLGGHIIVESDPDQGSCFIVDLPPSLAYNGESAVVRDQMEDIHAPVGDSDV
ncbi:ATP-binding protein [Longibacter sp.]|uniref:ATP-binding protein n=1 Tax=Longibacter sp. TaxID=2045415 RepID=UPI003EC06415